MAVWRALFFAPGTPAAEPTQTAEYNRGAYLVNGLGHCAACHTPRNALGAELAGYQDLTVYDGSWSEWGGDPARPVVSRHD